MLNESSSGNHLVIICHSGEGGHAVAQSVKHLLNTTGPRITSRTCSRVTGRRKRPDSKPGHLNEKGSQGIFSVSNFICFTAVFICAFALKYHYSIAETEDLKWILTPTATLVEILTGKLFFFDAVNGYVNTTYMVAIAKPCAGVNFLIIAFCMSAFNIILNVKSLTVKCLALPGSFIVLYMVTLFANTVRILVAIFIYNANLSFGSFTPEKLHRLEGIAIYFIFLFLLNYILLKYLEKCGEYV